eukprot:gene9644-1862_t
MGGNSRMDGWIVMGGNSRMDGWIVMGGNSRMDGWIVMGGNSRMDGWIVMGVMVLSQQPTRSLTKITASRFSPNHLPAPLRTQNAELRRVLPLQVAPTSPQTITV